MSFTLLLSFQDALSHLRHNLRRLGLETAVEWDATLDVRDSTGAQLTDIRCIYVFDPLELLHASQNAGPASALTTLTLRARGNRTEVTISGRGLAYRKACGALSPLRHAA